MVEPIDPHKIMERSRVRQISDAIDKLEKAGFKVRKVDSFARYFLVSTDHGGEGATSRWSSSWVRRYKYNG